MPPKLDEKITFISHTKVKVFKGILIVIGILLVIPSISTTVLYFMGREHLDLFLSFYLLVFIGLIYSLYLRIKAVEFDRSYLYVTEKNYDVIVPLSNIKKVEIRNMAGIYEITLFDKIQSGDKIFFKPSLIYPFDYKMQDDKVNRLRAYAWKARSVVEAASKNQLGS